MEEKVIWVGPIRIDYGTLSQVLRRCYDRVIGELVDDS
jgi:hypothetical protein